MYSVSGMMDQGPSKYSMSVSMYRGGGRGYGRPESAPPDLPSLLLDARICYLGMPVSNYLYISLLSSISTRIVYLSDHFPSVGLVSSLHVLSVNCRLYQLSQSFLLLNSCIWIMKTLQSLYIYI